MRVKKFAKNLEFGLIKVCMDEPIRELKDQLFLWAKMARS